MLVKLLEVLAYASITFVGLAMLPYLLWRGRDNRIPLKNEGRGLDLDSRGS